MRYGLASNAFVMSTGYLFLNTESKYYHGPKPLIFIITLTEELV
jgi:hypothetical protein